MSLSIIITDPVLLVAGLHRLEAARKLGWTEIDAHVVTLPDLHRQLAECDENLCGTKLSPAERAMFTRRRKEIYEALHPETRHGVAGGKARQGAAVDNLSFADDTAAKTGQDARTVRRDAARGENIPEDVLEEVKRWRRSPSSGCLAVYAGGRAGAAGGAP